MTGLSRGDTPAAVRGGQVGGHHLATKVIVAALALTAISLAVACVDTDPRERMICDNIHWTLSFGIAAFLAWRGVRQAGSPDVAQPRLWFAWAFTYYLIGQLAWNVEQVVNWTTFPGPSDVPFLLFAPLCAGGFLVALRRHVGPEQLRATLLDAFALAIASLAIVLVVYVPHQGAHTPLQLAVFIAYPTTLAFALSVAVVMTLKLRLQLQRGCVLFMLALVGQTCAWLQWNLDSLNGLEYTNTFLNASFTVCTIAQGLGAQEWHVRVSTSRRWRACCGGVLRLMPLLTVSLGGAAIVLTHALPNFTPLERWCALGAGLTVVALAAVRQDLLLAESDHLLRLERSLRLSEEAFRTVIDQAMDGVLIASAEGITQEASRRAETLLGMRREQLIGNPISMVIPPEHQERLVQDLRRTIQGEEMTVERSVRRGDGSLLDVEVRVKQLSDGRLLATMRDVSGSRAMEEQLRQSQKMEAVGTLAAGIAHDFNNLLMTIRGYADMAEEDLPPRHAARASIDEIRKASARAAQLVRQILTFSRPATPSMEAVRLQDIVGEAVSLLRATLPANVRIHVTAEPGASPVLADATQMHQVVMNLCTNAWHALEGRAGTIEIALACVDDARRVRQGLPSGEYILLRISDTGRGMDAETRQRIFEPFFTTKRTAGGTGLGLSVVHGIVRNHGGSIGVESLPGVGTTFSVYLPAARQDRLQATGVRGGGSGAVDAAGAPARRVLFIDDEKALVALAVQELQRRGYRVLGSLSAGEALAAIGDPEQRFDLVVSDQNMPRMTGIELLREIRQRSPGLRCILVSGVVDEGVRAAAAAVGIDRVVEKPVTMEDLCTVIQDVLAG